MSELWLEISQGYDATAKRRGLSNLIGEWEAAHLSTFVPNFMPASFPSTGTSSPVPLSESSHESAEVGPYAINTVHILHLTHSGILMISNRPGILGSRRSRRVTVAQESARKAQMQL